MAANDEPESPREDEQTKPHRHIGPWMPEDVSNGSIGVGRFPGSDEPTRKETENDREDDRSPQIVQSVPEPPAKTDPGWLCRFGWLSRRVCHSQLLVMILLGIVNLPKSEISGILMKCATNTSAHNYQGFRFPAEIISHAVWLYFRFSTCVSVMSKSFWLSVGSS